MIFHCIQGSSLTKASCIYGPTLKTSPIHNHANHVLRKFKVKTLVSAEYSAFSCKMPARGQYNKLSETDRAQAIGCWKVARSFQTSNQTINRIRHSYRQTGLIKDRPCSGRQTVTTRAEDRYVTNTVARNRFVTGTETRR